MASVRILKEFKDLQTDSTVLFSRDPVAGNNELTWRATICGPPNSPYAEGKFKVSIFFSTYYPLKPPKVKFRTKIFHRNIDEYGYVSLDILYNKWHPSLTIGKVFQAIFSLLVTPTMDETRRRDIADHMYKIDRANYEAIARAMTQKYAMA